MLKSGAYWRGMLDTAPPRILGVYLFCTTVLVFLFTQVNVTGGDSPPTVYLPVTLLWWGTLRLDPMISEMPDLFDVNWKTGCRWRSVY